MERGGAIKYRSLSSPFCPHRWKSPKIQFESTVKAMKLNVIRRWEKKGESLLAAAAAGPLTANFIL